VCAQVRAHSGGDDDVLDADLDALEAAAIELLRIPASGTAEALVLLTICHSRLYGPLTGFENPFFDKIQRLKTDQFDLDQELTWMEQDRAFLEAAIDALKGGC
jgi:hypothetical protein